MIALPAPAAGEPGAACDNCGAALVGPFCHHCGAPEVTHRDWTLRHFLADLAAEVTSLDRSKFGRTIATLCFRPGQLTADNFTGRRVRYLKPITLTLAIFALHLFVFTAFGDASSFSIRRLIPQDGSGSSALAPIGQAVDAVAARTRVPARVVMDGIDNLWIRNFSFFQIPLIAVLALWTRLILLRVRQFMVVHVVFGMHLISFTGFTVILLYPVLYLAGPPASAASLALVLVKFVFDCTWVSLAARRVYALSTTRAFLAGIAIQAGYVAAFNAAHQASLVLALRTALAG